MVTQIRKIQDARVGDIIATGDNRHEVEAWCRRIPYGDSLKVQTIYKEYGATPLITVRI